MGRLRRVHRPPLPPPPRHVRWLSRGIAVSAHAALLLALALVRLAEPQTDARSPYLPVVRISAVPVAASAAPTEAPSSTGVARGRGPAGGGPASEGVAGGDAATATPTPPRAASVGEVMEPAEPGTTCFARLDGPDGSGPPSVSAFVAAWDRHGGDAARPQAGPSTSAASGEYAASLAHRAGGPEHSVAASVPVLPPRGLTASTPRLEVAGVARVVPVIERRARVGAREDAGARPTAGFAYPQEPGDGPDEIRLGTTTPWRARVVRRVAASGSSARPKVLPSPSQDEVLAVAAVDEVVAVAAAHPLARPDAADDDRTERPARDAHNAMARTEGAAPTLQSAADAQAAGGEPQSFEGTLATEVDVGAKATPLGRYTQAALDLVNERWYDEDLPLEQRVAGVQGSVLVRFDVNRNGRVKGLKLLRRSGHAALDRMALRAVPSRLPAPPEEVPAPVRQQVAFRYINPFAVLE